MSDTAESDRMAGRRPYLEYPQPVANEQPAERASRLIEWAKNEICYLSPYRMRKWAYCRLADLFFDGDQWPTADSLGYVGTEMAVSYSPDEISLGDDNPRPVMNEYKDVILNEASRLDRSDYEPTARPAGTDPTYRQRNGAKIATRALRSSLEEDNWEAKKRQVAYHLPSYGGAWLETRWDTSMDETVRVPVDGCTICPVCQCKYAPGGKPSPLPGMPAEPLDSCQKCLTHDVEQAPDELTVAARAAQLPPEMMLEDGTAHPDAIEHVQAPVTITQPGGPPLEPYIPRDADLNAKDPYGRPLGEDVPIGNVRTNVLDYGAVFEEDLGIGMSGEMEVKGWTSVKVKSLDWIRNRFANARTGELRPESPQALLKYHPVCAGDWMLADDSIYRNSARVIERGRFPWMEERNDPASGKVTTYVLNRGKLVTVCGGLALQDDDLMIDGPDGKSFPRVLVTYTPHDLGSGGQERLGSSQSKQLIDAQRGINLSTVMDIDEQKNGQSCWLVHDGVDVNYENSGQAGATRTWHAPATSDNIEAYKPQLVSRTGEARKWGALSDYYRGYMGRAGRLTETESGSIPPDAPAAALQISREESGEVRKPRTEALSKTYQRHFRQRLQLMQKYVVELRVAWDKMDSGREVQSWYKGADFAGQTDVVVDVEGAADSELLKQKKLQDAIGNGTIDMMDPANKRRVGKLQGVPGDFFEAEDTQSQVAEREYLEFCGDTDPTDPNAMQFGVPPVVDPGVDNNQAHIEQHTKDLLSDKWREIENAVGWDKVLTCIAGWKQQVIQTMSPAPEVTAQPPPVEGQAPAPPPMPLPPNVDLLIPTPQIFIMGLWAQMIAQAAMVPDSPVAYLDPSNPALLSVLAFRAHHAEHQIREAFGGAAAAPQAQPPVA